MTSFIFDLDGTLSDTIPLIKQTTSQALARFGLSACDEEIAGFIGIPLVVVGEHFLGADRKEEYMQAFFEHYHQHNKEVKAFPGLPEMLTQLQAKGAKLAIATSKRRLPAYDTLEIIGLRHFFPVVVHSECNCGFKPGPGPVERAIADLGGDPAQSWFIGDSVHDIASAKAAGISSVGVTWGVTTRDKLAEAEPDYLCDEVGELHELLLRLLPAD
ncbi:MAG: HAD hydrolase-like protein [Clostridia bacterium]|nr:HAD hydrolase-like protein [Clostridia bacterium]